MFSWRSLSQVAVFSKADWVCNDIYENVSTPAVGHVADTSVPPCNVSRRRAHRNTTGRHVILYSHASYNNTKGFRNNNNSYDVV